jgi:hypothetical protein
MTRKSKALLILIPFGLLLIGGAIQGIQYWWRHGFSTGERSGILRKLSVKGSPVCKYMSGELVLSSNLAGVGGEVWEFTVDDKDEKNPTVMALEEASRGGQRVTLKYRQDKPMWWTCNPIEYKVIGVAK